MAIEFSSRGWRVAGGARNQDALADVQQDMQSDHFFDRLDVTIPEQVENFARSVKDKFGSPDLLVNNAGLINKNASLLDVSPEEFASVLTVNLGGVHNMIRSFLPMMQEAGRGIIANFSSYWGQSTAPEVAPYCATKWGVEGLTRSLAQELPSGLGVALIRVLLIRICWAPSTFGEEALGCESPDECDNMLSIHWKA